MEILKEGNKPKATCGSCDCEFTSPRDAFAELIDKVGKKGTWESNPYVFRYEFKLLR